MPSQSDGNRLEEIFFAAVEIEAGAKRNKYLDQACGGAPDLRRQIERLVSSHDQARDFLEQRPPFSVASYLGDPSAAQTLPPDSLFGSLSESPCPQLFGDYELLEKVAQGGMGIVFKARQISLNRIVALKMISAGEFAGPAEIQRFHVEAEAAARLDHVGIVPVYDVGCHHGRHYYSMAFVEGESLAARIQAGPLPFQLAAQILQKLAIAIQVAHDHGIIHRDLKPSNVLLDEHNQPRIADFGLAKQVEGNCELTATGVVLGTPSYMPPEQAAGKRADAAADVYSLGAIFYAMLTGRPPFGSPSQLDTILQVLHDDPVALRKLNPRVPRDLEAICLKCLEKPPGDRYRTAAELAADLGRFLAGEPIQAKNDWYRHLRRWTIREPVLAAHLSATAVLLLILLGSYGLWRDNGAGRAYNWQLLCGNSQILLGWAMGIWVLQQVQNRLRTKAVVSHFWAALNPIFLTIALFWNGSFGEDAYLVWLLPLYHLLMVTTCFFRRVELVAITTTCSLVGYGVLAYFYFTKSVLESPSYLVVSAVNMAGIGLLLCLLTHRLRRLGEQHKQESYR